MSILFNFATGACLFVVSACVEQGRRKRAPLEQVKLKQGKKGSASWDRPASSITSRRRLMMATYEEHKARLWFKRTFCCVVWCCVCSRNSPLTYLTTMLPEHLCNTESNPCGTPRDQDDLFVSWSERRANNRTGKKDQEASANSTQMQLFRFQRTFPARMSLRNGDFGRGDLISICELQQEWTTREKATKHKTAQEYNTR